MIKTGRGEICQKCKTKAKNEFFEEFEG